MSELLRVYIEKVNQYGISKLYFFDLADSIEGILRLSSLAVIKYGVVESTIKYATYMIHWLNALSEYVDIDYYGCLGNHDEIRLLNSKSGDFSKENMHFVISTIIQFGLANNNKVNVFDSKDKQYIDVEGFKIFATHGQGLSSLSTAVKDFKEMYDVDIDYMLVGHLHSQKQETVSMYTKIIQFPSIVGIDDYSVSLRKTANAEGCIILLRDKEFTVVNVKL